MILVLENILQAYVSKKQSSWEDYLHMVDFAYNNAKHSSTGYNPFILMYKFQPTSPITIRFPGLTHEAARDFLQDMQNMLHIAPHIIGSAQDRDPYYPDKHRSPRELLEGMMVYL